MGNILKKKNNFFDWYFRGGKLIAEETSWKLKDALLQP